MSNRLPSIVLPAVVGVLGVAAVVLWARVEPPEPIAARVPGMDDAPSPEGLRAPGTDEGPSEPMPEPRPLAPGEPIAGQGEPSALDGAWPWFRGPGRDAIARDGVRLARKWPPGGPRRLWQITLGEGYAAAAAADGRVYVLDHAADPAAGLLRGLLPDNRQRLADALEPEAITSVEQIDPLLAELFAAAEQYAELKALLQEALAEDREALVRALRYGWIDEIDRSTDVLRCLSLDDGREIWRNGYRVVVPLHHGRSRTIPAVYDGHVVTIGPRCHVVGWDAASGEPLWAIDMVRDFGATVPPWYTGQCPLIDEAADRLILAPGGDALLVAVDYRTGGIVWESPNPHGWTMTHSSVIPMELAGRRMYVYAGKGGVAGVAADDGSILWETTDWQIGMATCPSPVPLGDGRIFLSGGYNAGALMLRVVEQGGRFRAETLYRLDARAFGSEQHTPVLYEGHLYGVRQRDGRLVCLDLEGNERWQSGQDRFGAGPYMIADGLIFVLDNSGKLTMAEATPDRYRVLDQAVVLPDGIESWGPMALVGRRLIVRDMTRMVCVEVGE
jgi:outer membrane protein assembly factor BamB